MNSYLLNRKIHRLLVLVVALSTLVMIVTGIFLKYGWLTDALRVDYRLMQMIHNVASPFYAIVLGLMTITGTVMYLYPMFKSKK